MPGGVDIPIIHWVPVTVRNGVRCKGPRSILVGSGPSRFHGNASLCPQPRNSPLRSRGHGAHVRRPARARGRPCTCTDGHTRTGADRPQTQRDRPMRDHWYGQNTHKGGHAWSINAHREARCARIAMERRGSNRYMARTERRI